MFNHVVLYRLKEGVSLDRVRAARESLGALVETLPGVVHFAVTHNAAAESNGYRLVLFSVFQDRSAFDIYSRHPEVQRIEREDLSPVVAERLVAEGEG